MNNFHSFSLLQEFQATISLVYFFIAATMASRVFFKYYHTVSGRHEDGFCYRSIRNIVSWLASFAERDFDPMSTAISLVLSEQSS